MKIIIPPIKCQGIKSKLVPRIKDYVKWNKEGKWIEPFTGSGVVGFNISPDVALFCDSNPYIIKFYNSINNESITSSIVREFLESEGEQLSLHGKEYYYEVRNRFNENHNPLDFLFLNRSCFNGLIRFNRNGGFNVPFGHKPNRFAKAYVTKICNQVENISKLTRINDWTFKHQSFQETFIAIEEDDFVYCDPPYIGRHVDYFNGWSEKDEKSLFDCLNSCPSNFILSTWHSNEHRSNPFIDSYWSKFNILLKEHFYHVGAKESNRKPMLEALILNYKVRKISEKQNKFSQIQIPLETHVR